MNKTYFVGAIVCPKDSPDKIIIRLSGTFSTDAHTGDELMISASKAVREIIKSNGVVLSDDYRFSITALNPLGF